jgi:hypothetical protein
MRKALIFSAISLAAISSAIAQDTITAGSYPRAETDFYVPSGKLRTVGRLYGAQLDCTPWSVSEIEVRITQEPKNGTLKIVPGEVVAGFKTESPLAKCNGKKMPALNVNYKSNDKYVGTDEFELFVIWPNSRAQEQHATINVK